MSTFICSIMCNYSKVYMVTSKMLNLYVPVHKEVRRQLLYFKYLDNIFVFFTYTFSMQCQQSRACAQKNVDKIHTIMEKLKLRILKIQILRNTFFCLIQFWRKWKPNWKKTAWKKNWSELDPKNILYSWPHFCWKNHFETIQFWIQENPKKKKPS